MSAIPGTWTAEELMHGKDDHHDAAAAAVVAGGVASLAISSPNGSPMSKSPTKRFTMSKMGKKKPPSDPMDWGMPGHLTEGEVAIFMKFRDEVEKRGGEFKNTVYSFGEVEGEAFCLNRWLRARKFKYDDVIAMIEEATNVRAEARNHDFYPNPVEALGCEPSIFISQYPQLYHGSAMNGCPVFISKPGVLNVDAIECITTLDGIVKYHWHVMMHDYKMRLLKHKEAHPEFNNFQCVCVLDLEHLSTTQISQRALGIIKTQTAIDSVCFPETMNKMLLINVPRFFSLTWSIIKGWIDPRTAGKVELISSRKSWEARLRELVDADQLPSDYGGTGMATTETLAKDAPKGVMKQHHELVHVRLAGHSTVDVPKGGEMEVTIFTRSTTEVTISVVDEHHKSTMYAPEVPVKHTGGSGENDQPTSVVITKSRIKGPVTARIRIDCKGGSRFHTAGNYMVACNIFGVKGG